jgi:uncharacterized protein YmfQ (DUF2313 family)
MSKREQIQDILEQYYEHSGELDSQYFIEDLAERGYQVVKVRKHVPRPARKVITEFLTVMYSEEGQYLAGVDEAILISHLADAGYHIVKVGEEESNDKS